jgi:hypothetical protein
MDKHSNTNSSISAQPRLHQHAAAIQPYGTVNHALPLELEEPVRLEMTERLNQLLADTITIRDLYKKSHWQVAGPTFYRKRPKWAVLTGVVFGQVSIKKSSRHIRRYEDKSQGALISSV